MRERLMAEPEVEAAWRAEFKWCGATQSRDALNSDGGFTDELKRQTAFGGWAMKPKRDGSSRNKATPISGGFLVAVAAVSTAIDRAEETLVIGRCGSLPTEL
jgi:hypothetical protein